MKAGGGDRPHNEQLIRLLSVAQLVFGEPPGAFLDVWPPWAAPTRWHRLCATELFGCANLPCWLCGP